MSVGKAIHISLIDLVWRWAGIKTHKLIREEEDGLEGEMSVADLEEILQGGTQEIDDHDVIVALSAGVHDPGNARTTHERLVDLGFLAEGRRERAWNGWLELDSDFFARYGVHAEEDGACGTHEATAKCARTKTRTAATVGDFFLESVLAAKCNVHLELGGRGRGHRAWPAKAWFSGSNYVRHPHMAMCGMHVTASRRKSMPFLQLAASRPLLAVSTFLFRVF